MAAVVDAAAQIGNEHFRLIAGGGYHFVAAVIPIIGQVFFVIRLHHHLKAERVTRIGVHFNIGKICAVRILPPSRGICLEIVFDTEFVTHRINVAVNIHDRTFVGSPFLRSYGQRPCIAEAFIVPEEGKTVQVPAADKRFERYALVWLQVQDRFVSAVFRCQYMEVVVYDDFKPKGLGAAVRVRDFALEYPVFYSCIDVGRIRSDRQRTIRAVIGIIAGGRPFITESAIRDSLYRHRHLFVRTYLEILFSDPLRIKILRI